MKQTRGKKLEYMDRMTRRGFIAAAGGAVAAAALAGCSQGQQASASGNGSASSSKAGGVGDSNLYFTHQEVCESPEWVKKAAEAAAKDADQLIVVAGVGKTCAYITMHEKDGGAWKQIIATPGFIGKDGMGDANIEDAYTPIGAFTIDKAFGLEADPGCVMDYTQVDETYYWSGDAREGMHFNELVTTRDLPNLDTEESKHIAEFDYAYRYVLNMGYNAECEVRKGFAFFLHSFRVNRPYTGGCVAVPEDIMRFIMQHVRPGCRIALDTLESFGGDLDAQLQDIDYMALVNKLNALPEGWEDAVEIVHMTNSEGSDVEVEAKAYEAYQALKADLEKEGVHIDLDSAYRNVADQERIMKEFTEEYGADYAKKTVAPPGYSEHHTGLALDLYLIIDGKEVDENADMMKHPEVWQKIHAKLAEHGFILRYLDGDEHITGYAYEPWHIRYLDDAAIAKEIMDAGITFEEYKSGKVAPEVSYDYGDSTFYTAEELEQAAIQVKCEFATFAGCELHSLRYAGDEFNTKENLEWLKSLDEGRNFVQVAKFTTDFHSPVEGGGAWEPDTEMKDWEWWLAREEGKGWLLVTNGYN